MKKKILMLCPAVLASISVWSQSIGPSVINSSGSSAVIAGSTYEFSIGELISNTSTGPGIVITQGVLQPSEEPTGIDDKQFFADNLKLFPNPAEDVVFLQPSFTKGGTLACNLYDALGRIISQSEFTLSTGKEKQTMSLKMLASGTYMLDVSYKQAGKDYHTAYKVQKVQ
jgi:hypothetical protein